MELPKSASLASKLVYVSETGSTNSDLILAASTGGESNWPDFSVYVTGFQTAGRGRAGRQWLAPPASSLFVSVLIRTFETRIENFGWLPLLAGLAMSRAVGGRLDISAANGSAAASVNASQVGVKWPNDVLVSGRKVSGVLSELLPDLSGVVVGAGLNLTLSVDQLPIESATSLALLGDSSAEALLGGAIDASNLDDILFRYLSQLRGLVAQLRGEKADFELSKAALADLHRQVSDSCITLGQQVRAILPGDREIWGTAQGIDEQARLIVQTVEGDTEIISAGDIIHLRSA